MKLTREPYFRSLDVASIQPEQIDCIAYTKGSYMLCIQFCSGTFIIIDYVWAISNTEKQFLNNLADFSPLEVTPYSSCSSTTQCH